MKTSLVYPLLILTVMGNSSGGQGSKRYTEGGSSDSVHDLGKSKTETPDVSATGTSESPHSPEILFLTCWVTLPMRDLKVIWVSSSGSKYFNVCLTNTYNGDSDCDFKRCEDTACAYVYEGIHGGIRYNVSVTAEFTDTAKILNFYLPWQLSLSTSSSTILIEWSYDETVNRVCYMAFDPEEDLLKDRLIRDTEEPDVSAKCVYTDFVNKSLLITDLPASTSFKIFLITSEGDSGTINSKTKPSGSYKSLNWKCPNDNPCSYGECIPAYNGLFRQADYYSQDYYYSCSCDDAGGIYCNDTSASGNIITSKSCTIEVEEISHIGIEHAEFVHIDKEPSCIMPSSVKLMSYWCNGLSSCSLNFARLQSYLPQDIGCSDTDMNKELIYRFVTNPNHEAPLYCPDSYTLFEEHKTCYKNFIFAASSLTFHGARQRCLSEGGDLPFYVEDTNFTSFVENNLSAEGDWWTLGRSSSPRPPRQYFENPEPAVIRGDQLVRCQYNETCSEDIIKSFICAVPPSVISLPSLSTQFQTIDSCASSPCQNGGSCYISTTLLGLSYKWNLNDTFSYMCRCPDGYYGEYCEIEGHDYQYKKLKTEGSFYKLTTESSEDVFQIEYVFFGLDSKCYAPSALTFVKLRCNGRSSCYLYRRDFLDHLYSSCSPFEKTDLYIRFRILKQKESLIGCEEGFNESDKCYFIPESLGPFSDPDDAKIACNSLGGDLAYAVNNRTICSFIRQQNYAAAWVERNFGEFSEAEFSLYPVLPSLLQCRPRQVNESISYPALCFSSLVISSPSTSTAATVPLTVSTTGPATVPTTVSTTGPATVPTTSPATVPATVSTTGTATVPTTGPATVSTIVSSSDPTTVPTSFKTTVPTTVATNVSASLPTTVPTTISAKVSTPDPTTAAIVPTTTAANLNGLKCPTVEDNFYDGYVWNETVGGTTASQPCPQQFSGTAYYICQANGEWEEYPDYSNCTSDFNADYWADRIINESLDLGVTLQEMAVNISNTELASGDIPVILDLVDLAIDQYEEDLSNSTSYNESVIIADSYTLGMVDVCGVLTEDQKLWEGLPSNLRANSSTRLQVDVDFTGLSMTKYVSHESRTYSDSFLSLTVEKFPGIYYIAEDKRTYSHPQISFPSTYIILPRTIVKGTLVAAVSITFTAYSSLQFDVPNGIPNSENSEIVLNFTRTAVPNTAVIGATVNDVPFNASDNDPVIASFSHIYPGNEYNLTRKLCAWWDYDINDWSIEGCIINDTDDFITICHCYHLTNLAVIMDINGHLEDSPVILELSMYITVIGCSVSIVCLFITIVILSQTLKPAKTTNVIHLNLCLCLLIAEIILMGGLDATFNPTTCGIIAGLLFYFLLATFTWTSVEAANIYMLFVKIFPSDRSPLKLYIVIGYTFPAVIVGISAAASGGEGFGTSDYCWLSTDNNMIWAFAAPLLVILLGNLIIYVAALRVLASHHKNLGSLDSTRTSSMKKLWESSFTLLSVLGLTWILGFFYMFNGTQFMAILFTLVNSLQGLILFLTLILLKKEKRNEISARWRRILKNKEKAKVKGANRQRQDAASAKSNTTSFSPSSLQKTQTTVVGNENSTASLGHAKLSQRSSGYSSGKSLDDPPYSRSYVDDIRR